MSIVQTLKIAHNKGLHRSHETLGFRLFHWLWVPHVMCEDVMPKREAIAQHMIPYLKAIARDEWKHFVRGYES
jgi:hypothetical protein